MAASIAATPSTTATSTMAGAVSLAASPPVCSLARCWGVPLPPSTPTGPGLRLPCVCLSGAGSELRPSAADLLVLLPERWGLLPLRPELPGALGAGARPVGHGSTPSRPPAVPRSDGPAMSYARDTTVRLGPRLVQIPRGPHGGSYAGTTPSRGSEDARADEGLSRRVGVVRSIEIVMARGSSGSSRKIL
jgi:hypothetical protein